ncbi:MAG: haloacid dehalogenase type II [Pseudomonadota bacterium]
MTKRLSDYKVLTFDCYGTLIDWESGIWDALQPLLMASGRADITRGAALMAYAEVESAQQAETPGLIYPELLSRVHAGFAAKLGLTTSDDLDQAFGQSIGAWPAFPDSADALRFLKSRYKLVILSNVNGAGFALSNQKLGVQFDAIYTAEDVGSYKPDPKNFEYMLAHLKQDLGLEQDAILHTAQSLFHDHAPARRFGLANAWIDRQGLSKGGDWGATRKLEAQPEVDFLFPTMGAMADAVKVEG